MTTRRFAGLLASLIVAMLLVPALALAAVGAPVAQDVPVTTAEDTIAHIVLTATDTADPATSFDLAATSPSHGSLGAIGSISCDGLSPETCTAPVDYTPDLNYHGSDAFTYTATNGAGVSNEATVSITVSPVNDLPVAVALNPSAPEDAVQHVTLAATDVDGDPLSFAIGAVSPAHGSLGAIGAAQCDANTPSSCTANVDYTPVANFNGTDSFTYTANDGVGTSVAATVSLTITPVNDPPVASALTPSTTEGTSKVITMSATDVDGGALTFALGPTHVAHGTLGTFGTPSCDGLTPSSCTATATYTPNANFNGTDSFTYVANDGTASSNEATVTITVVAVDSPPVCPDSSSSGAEDTTISGTQVCTDVDSLNLTYAKVTSPAHGTATVNADGTWTYHPNANYNGPDAFTYKASDSILDSPAATVSLTVTPVNDPPNAANDVGLTVSQNAAAAVLPVLQNDSSLPDVGETISIVAVSQGGHGKVAFTAASLSYTPAPTYRGTDTFTYTISDGKLTDTATVFLTVVKAGTVGRLAGADRYATSAAISRASFTPGVPVVYIASGLGFADALSGAPVAGIRHGPILLVPGTSIPASIAAELIRLKPATIVILGGTSVVSSGVATQLKGYTTGTVGRLAGADRYATSAAISRASFTPGVPVVYIASGLGFADALSGAPVAGIRHGPILLVPGTSIPASIAAELIRLKPATIVILGGTSVVSSGVATQLGFYTTGP